MIIRQHCSGNAVLKMYLPTCLMRKRIDNAQGEKPMRTSNHTVVAESAWAIVRALWKHSAIVLLPGFASRRISSAALVMFVMFYLLRRPSLGSL
jgi:hypothetical protein